jgi:hypothetical protein
MRIVVLHMDNQYHKVLEKRDPNHALFAVVASLVFKQYDRVSEYFLSSSEVQPMLGIGLPPL